jgi:hypothetical protein
MDRINRIHRIKSGFSEGEKESEFGVNKAIFYTILSAEPDPKG